MGGNQFNKCDATKGMESHVDLQRYTLLVQQYLTFAYGVQYESGIIRDY